MRVSPQLFGGAPAALILFSLAALPSLAQAQSAPSPVRETASVSAVEVPVNVIGRDGRPVAGLTAADFELWDNGKKQTITGFEIVDLNLPAAPSASGADKSGVVSQPAARRHWLIVFDLSYTSLTGLLRAREGAEAFVHRAMKASDLAAVATLSVDTGWKLLANFSADKKQLTAAIRTLGLPGLTARSSDPLGLVFTAPTAMTPDYTGTNPRSALMAEDMKELQAALQKPATDSQARGKVSELMKSLAGMGRILDSVRGRKHVLFFSEGFDTRHLSGSTPMTGGSGVTFDRSAPTNETANAAVSGEVWKVDSDARFGSSSTRNVFSQALSEFKRSDTVVDAIDISGLRAAGDVSNNLRPGSGTDALFAMASATDGDFVRNANQLGGEIEKLVERTGLVYLLVFQPTERIKPGSFHEIRVKTKPAGARVLARSGYYERRPFAALSSIERVLASGDLITGGTKENSLSADLLCAAVPGEGPLAQVPVVLDIAGGPLLAGQPRVALQIYAYAIDSSGTLADYLSQEMTLDIALVREKLESGGIKFYGVLTLPEGEYTVRSLVRESWTGRSAVLVSRVRVSAAGGAATVLPPFFPDRSGRWLFVKGTPHADASSKSQDYPFSVEGESFVPAARPVLPARADAAAVPVTVMTFNFGGPGRLEPLQVVPEVFGEDGKPRSADVSVVRRSDVEKAGGRAMMLAMKTGGLAPGRYVLKVRVSDRVSRKSAEAASDFEVK